MKPITVQDRRWKQDPFDWHVSNHTYTVSDPIHTSTTHVKDYRISLG